MGLFRDSNLASTLAALSLALAPGLAVAGPPVESGVPSDVLPKQLHDVGITEHLGDQVPLDVSLVDESGQPVQLARYFSAGKPVALNFVYHTCPTLCSMVQSGFASSLKGLAWDIGTQFEVLTVSIDERDTPQIASEKKAQWVGSYGRDRAATERGWHFLTGKADQVKRLADAIGFSYKWDQQQQQYAHAAAVYVLTPTGKIARYLYGIEYPPRDMRLALAEAAEGRSIGTIDHLLLYCYQYDPTARGYVLVAQKAMRIGGAVFVGFLGLFLGGLWLHERKRADQQDAAPPAPADPKAGGDQGPQDFQPRPQ